MPNSDAGKWLVAKLVSDNERLDNVTMLHTRSIDDILTRVKALFEITDGIERQGGDHAAMIKDLSTKVGILGQGLMSLSGSVEKISAQQRQGSYLEPEIEESGVKPLVLTDAEDNTLRFYEEDGQVRCENYARDEVVLTDVQLVELQRWISDLTGISHD